MRHSKSTADSNDKRRKATCHCGAVELELSLPDGIVNPRHCDCSSCRRKGAIVTSVPLSGIRIVKGRDALKLYQFTTHTALEGVNPFDLAPVTVNVGGNHQADRGSQSAAVVAP